MKKIKRFLKFPMKPSNGYTTIISKKPTKTAYWLSIWTYETWWRDAFSGNGNRWSFTWLSRWRSRWYRDLITGEKAISLFECYLVIRAVPGLFEKELGKGFADLVLEPFLAQYPFWSIPILSKSNTLSPWRKKILPRKNQRSKRRSGKPTGQVQPGWKISKKSRNYHLEKVWYWFSPATGWLQRWVHGTLSKHEDKHRWKSV